MLKRNEVNIIKEGWATGLLTKYKDNFNEFFTKLKHQFQYNAKAKAILSGYITTGAITKADVAELKTMSTDLLKMVGLGAIAVMPIPGGILLMLFLINSAKHIGIDLIPSHFEAVANGIDYNIKVEDDDEDGDRTAVTIYNTDKTQPNMIGKLIFEKTFTGLDLMGVIDEDEYDRIFPDDSYVRIEHIKVEPFYARTGFGRILMDVALVEIGKTKFDRIYLNASPMGHRFPSKISSHSTSHLASMYSTRKQIMPRCIKKYNNTWLANKGMLESYFK